MDVDGVNSEVDRRLGIAVTSAILSADGNNVLKTLDVYLVGRLASEKVQKHALGKSKFVADRAFECSAGKQNHGSQADSELLSLELGNGSEALGIESVGTLLLAAAKDEQTGIVLLGEKLERSSIVKRVDSVLLGEFLSQWLAHLVKVVEGVLDDLRARCSAEEKACLGVFVGLGLALL
ncbi:hypothetical protein HG531_013955 [Fusarium graminearum]|nr:hypothetical protein HG531_013955 [Fusarium graminearum]